MKRIPLTIGIMLFALLLSGQVFAAGDVYVSPTGSDTTGDGSAEASYATIQKGVDEVDAEGIVHIGSGAYTEQIVVTKNLTLAGENNSTTILNAPTSIAAESGGTVQPIIEINGVSATISNLTIQGELTGENNLVGIHARNGAIATISNNIIQNIKNSETDQEVNGSIEVFQNIGVLVSDSGTAASVENNTFTGYTHANVDQAGIKVEKLAGATITSNTFTNYIYTGTYTKRISIGVIVWDGANDGGVTINGNTFQNNHVAIGIDATEGVEITNNTITTDTASYSSQVPNHGIWISGEYYRTICAEGAAQGEGCAAGATISNNTITGGGSGYGIRIGIRALTGRTPVATTAEISENTITNWGSGIWNDTARTNNTLTISTNTIQGNTTYGVENPQSYLINATENYWGDSSGPSGQGPGTGDAITANVNFNPWYVDEDLSELSNEATPTYSITATIGRGEGSASPSSQAIEEGNPASITITPNTGYVVTRIYDNGNEVSVPENNILTIASVTGNHEIVAVLLASSEELISDSTSLTGTKETAVITDTFSGTGIIQIGSDSTNPKIDFSDILSGNSATLPGKIEMTRVAGAGTMRVEIPSGAIITGPSGWSGVLKALRYKTTSNATFPVSEGKAAQVGTLLDLGLSGQSITLSNAARLFFPGDVGKRIGYTLDSLTVTEIANACADDSQATGDTLAANGDCKIEIGGDLIIWTKHFTEFITFEETDPQAPDPPSASPVGKTSTSTSITVSLIPDVDADSTRYTLDGTNPTETSTLYTVPFAISGANQSITLKARSWNEQGAGNILVETYIFDTAGPAVTSYTLGGSTANVSFSPNSTTTNITINTNESAKFNRIYICGNSDGTCDDSTAKKWFTATSSYETSVTKTWDGKDSGGTIVADGEYKIKILTVDSLGNTATSELTPYTITIDTTAPATPTLDSVATSTTEATQELSGGKDGDASVFVNNATTTANTSTTWSVTVNLSEGENIFTILAKDDVGNESATTTITITREVVSTPSPVVVTIVPAGGGYSPSRTTPILPTPVTPSVAPQGEVLGVAVFRFTGNLERGVENDDVKELQNRLTKEGVYSGPITGYFGPQTQAAVIEYQKQKGIEPAIGYVGPLTREHLNANTAKVTQVEQGTSAQAAVLRAQIVSLQAQLVTLLNELMRMLQQKLAQ